MGIIFQVRVIGREKAVITRLVKEIGREKADITRLVKDIARETPGEVRVLKPRNFVLPMQFVLPMCGAIKSRRQNIIEKPFKEHKRPSLRLTMDVLAR